jgi:hypothetical protein
MGTTQMVCDCDDCVAFSKGKKLSNNAKKYLFCCAVEVEYNGQKVQKPE